MRDDSDFNIELCEIIQKYPELYDYNRSDYSNRCVQDKTWELIAKKLNESAADCKERWKNIRGRYGKVHKAQTQPSGSTAKKIKAYYLGPHLQFLNNFLKSRAPKENIDVREPFDDNDNSILDDGEESSSSLPPTRGNSSPTVTDYKPPILSNSAASMNINHPTLDDIHRSAYDFFTSKRLKLESQVTDSYDLDFLKSLIPDMAAMTPLQKRRFKIGVLKLAGEILEENEENYTAN